MDYVILINDPELSDMQLFVAETGYASDLKDAEFFTSRSAAYDRLFDFLTMNESISKYKVASISFQLDNHKIFEILNQFDKDKKKLVDYVKNMVEDPF